MASFLCGPEMDELAAQFTWRTSLDRFVKAVAVYSNVITGDGGMSYGMTKLKFTITEQPGEQFLLTVEPDAPREALVSLLRLVVGVVRTMKVILLYKPENVALAAESGFTFKGEGGVVAVSSAGLDMSGFSYIGLCGK